MKNLALILIILLTVVSTYSQTPQLFNYQGVAHNNNSNLPIRQQIIKLLFKIREGNINGIVIFDETQTTITDNSGLFNVKIGDVNKQSFSKIDWATGKKFLEVTINNEVSGITELVSVPYSLYTNKASYAELAKSSKDWVNVGDSLLYSANKKVGIGTTKPEAPFDLNGFIRIKGNNTTSTRIRFDAASANDDHLITSFDEKAKRIWVLNLADRSIGNRFGLYSEKTKSYVFNVTTDGNIGIKTNARSAYALSVKGDAYFDGSASVEVLTVRGGGDVYETWNAKDPIPPGYIVIIDTTGPENSIQLTTRPYDPLVVGVVSEAGAIRAGIGLTQRGVLEGNTKVACLGRVKVYVTGHVKPGDLLTSSDKPGHAMAVKKKRVESGVVLGKALSKPDNDGLVLMQVMLR